MDIKTCRTVVLAFTICWIERKHITTTKQFTWFYNLQPTKNKPDRTISIISIVRKFNTGIKVIWLRLTWCYPVLLGMIVKHYMCKAYLSNWPFIISFQAK